MASSNSSASNSEKSNVSLSDFQFVSDDHTRYENEQAVKADNKGCMRGIRVQKNVAGGKGYTVTVYNLDKGISIWADNIQMSPKQMEITHNSNAGIKLRGFGKDSMGNDFSDYGITIHLLNEVPSKITLNLYDRNIYIVYSKYNSFTESTILLDETSVANTLVQQHFGHYLSTNQAISVDDLEADVANLISYLRLYKDTKSPFSLEFLDKKLLDFIRNGKAEFASDIIKQAMELYPQHFQIGNAISCMQIETENSETYKGDRISEFLKKEYRKRHLYNI